MTILKIYKLEDPEEAEALSTFTEGEHIIGRGILNCNDKRVSRKHARIVIEKDGVTIKSEHVNPCFHKSFVSNSISILPKDKSVVLNDNDQFALLSDSFWFRVKVIKDNEEQRNSITDSTKNNIANNQILNIATPAKRNNDSSNDSSLLKRQKTSYNSSSKSPVPEYAIAGKLLANLETIVAEDYGDNEANDLNLTACTSNNKNEVVDDESSNNGKEAALVTVGAEKQEGCSKEIQKVNPDFKTVNMLLLKTPLVDQCTKDTLKDESSSTITIKTENDEDDSKENREESTILDINKIKNENSEAERVNTASNNANNLSDNANSSSYNVNNGSENANNTPENSNNATDNMNNTTDNVNNIIDNVNNATDNVDNASDNSNNASNMKKRRDRCWYGQTCYRKNQQHRIDLSHPGDDDYESDPNDDRPNCPFGDTCYRVNLDHRREFKHRGKPGPKPSDLTSPGTSHQITKTKKKRNKKKQPRKKANSDESNAESDNPSDTDQNTPPRKKRKAAPTKLKLNETPEDDYDYEDPFIDDASSEEFKVSDADEDDDDDSDWEDSQEVDEESQETRRLLKEAKKFTKRKT